jgi:AbrB family looped-hinge helix DNA binding protein
MPLSQGEIRVGEQGCIVIPADIRRELWIDIGSTLVARVEDDKLVLEKPDAVLKRLQARFKKVPNGISLAEELICERRTEAVNE